MKTGIIGLSILLTLSTFSVVAQKIDTKKSKITFEVGNMKVNTVEGTFTGMNGTIHFNQEELTGSNFNVCIDAATVNTGSKKRDDHLRTADFFDVEKYPTICFTSKSIEKTAKGFITKGELTMHGITKMVEIPFTYSEKTFTGELKVNRLEYKVGEETNTFMVGDEIELVILCKEQ